MREEETRRRKKEKNNAPFFPVKVPPWHRAVEKKFRRSEGKTAKKKRSVVHGAGIAFNVPSVVPPKSTEARAKGGTSPFRRGSVPRGKTGAWQGQQDLTKTASSSSSSLLLLPPSSSSAASSSRTRRRRQQTRRIRWRCARSTLRQGAQRQTRGLRKGSSSKGSRGEQSGDELVFFPFSFWATL